MFPSYKQKREVLYLTVRWFRDCKYVDWVHVKAELRTVHFSKMFRSDAESHSSGEEVKTAVT